MGTGPTGLFLLQTWTSRSLMKFYAVVAASPTSWESHKIAERIEQRILNSNPVMEAFGELNVLCTGLQSHFLWDCHLPGKGAVRLSLWGLKDECIIHCLGPPTSSQVSLAFFQQSYHYSVIPSIYSRQI